MLSSLNALNSAFSTTNNLMMTPLVFNHIDYCLHCWWYFHCTSLFWPFLFRWEIFGIGMSSSIQLALAKTYILSSITRHSPHKYLSPSNWYFLSLKSFKTDVLLTSIFFLPHPLPSLPHHTTTTLPY
jgi:hypothetical protein